MNFSASGFNALVAVFDKKVASANCIEYVFPTLADSLQPLRFIRYDLFIAWFNFESSD